MIKKINEKYNYLNNENLYVGKDNLSIGYADGGEAQMLEILDKINDRSIFSDELSIYMLNWPLEYHLSKKRHLIIRKFDIKKGDKVLELGAGCGAITRYLAEIGAEVTAVEGEYARAKVIAKRCEGYDNVSIVVDNILDFKSEIKYDWILLIGVLEYSPKYGRTENPVEEYLSIVRGMINENGKLIVAIENKLGIKYINGASEDHNGKMQYGTQDLYGKNEITTWGRKELVDIIRKSGFEDVVFSGVFPDYKLPKVIFTEAIEKNNTFRAEELLLYVKSLDYQGNNGRLFDEALYASALRKNNLLIDFSNSFLIEASINKNDVKTDEEVLAYYYSMERKSSYITLTKFSSCNYDLIVQKYKLIVSDLNEIQVFDSRGVKYLISHIVNPSKEKYLDGRSLGYEFTQANASDKYNIITDILIKWANKLTSDFAFYCRKSKQRLENSEINSRILSELLIDGLAFDCGPQNIISGSEDCSFDLEWVCNSPIPLSWVLTRNINHINRHAYVAKTQLSNENLVGLMADLFGLRAFVGDIQEANLLEAEFQKFVSNPEPSSTVNLVNLLN